jgi:hypothetical protein
LPNGVADADFAQERRLAKLGLERTQLALRAAARQAPVFQRGHAGRVIASVFEPLERINEMLGHRLASENADDPAHRSSAFSNASNMVSSDLISRRD